MAFKPNLRLSSAVLGGLARPDFAKDAGEALGKAMLGPENRRKEREKLEAITGIATATNAGVAASQMSDLAGLNQSISDLQSRLPATTDAPIASEITKQIGTLQGLVPQTRKGAALNSVNALEAARQAAETPEQARNIENIMERVARESGNSTEGIIGRTDSEIEAQRTLDEQTITDNFYAVPKENREAYLRGAEAKGFGQIASILEARELEREADQIKIDNARDSAALRRTPLPVAGLTKRIEALPESQEKTDLLERIEVAESQNIKKGQQFEPGQQDRLARELTSINDGITRAAGREDQAALLVDRQTEKEIRMLEAKDTSKITAGQRDAKIEDAIEQLMKENAFGRTLGRFGGAASKPDFDNDTHEALIKARATKLAKDEAEALKQERLRQLRAASSEGAGGTKEKQNNKRDSNLSDFEERTNGV